MKHTPKAVFVMENSGYKEITYDKFLALKNENKEFQQRRFISLHGVLMEVSEEDYREYYRQKRREKYYTERARDNNDFSYDMLTTNEFNGEDILISQDGNVEDIVEHKMLSEKLINCLSQLTAQEFELIEALYYDGLSERKISAMTATPQKTINDRKRQILLKLRKLMES